MDAADFTAHLDERTLARFWARVDRTPGLGPAGECRLWRGAVGDTGYGQINVGGKTVPAHHVAYFLANEERVPAGQILRHAPIVCHTKTCCNAAHLRPGTRAENSADRVLDGTARERRCLNDHPAVTFAELTDGGRLVCRKCGTEEWKLAWPAGRRAKRAVQS